MALLTAATALTTSGAARAAGEIGLGAAYDPRVAVGNFRDFVPDIAFQGVQARWEYYPIDAIAIGFVVQYQFFQRGVETDTVPIPNGAVTAPNFRSISFLSVMPTARYYFSTRGFRPYAEIGVGMSDSTSEILVSDLTQREHRGSLIVQPSLGVLWCLSPDLADTAAGRAEHPFGYIRKPLESMFALSASIAYSFTTMDVVGATNVGYAGIQLGIYAKP
jgi:hypothetical protein